MSNLSFKVEEKAFSSDSKILEAERFVVRSVPRPYGLSFDGRPNPWEVINERLSENAKNLLLIDENIYKIYGKNIKIEKDKVFVARATEEFKTIEGVLKVVDFLQKNKLTKGEKLIVAGGGIIQDVGAFTGAVFKRGIFWVYVPTTLLSMCDSCIGGKTGINHGNAKNQLALFSAPAEVIINVNFLKTLDPSAINSGMGEILKLVITGGGSFLDAYSKNVTNGKVINFPVYRKLILAALAVKKAIVEEDEFELNHRRSLNYGHTMGHVVEVLSNYRIPHGQAVIIGVIIADRLSLNRNMISEKEVESIEKLSLELLSPEIRGIVRALKVEEMASLLQKDKKTLGNKIYFVLIRKPGDTIFVPIEINSSFVSEIEEIMRRFF